MHQNDNIYYNRNKKKSNKRATTYGGIWEGIWQMILLMLNWRETRYKTQSNNFAKH